MKRIIIDQHKWLRLVRYARGNSMTDTYTIHVRHWFIWWEVCFGPYRPYPLGIVEFSNYYIALAEYSKCLTMKKSYTLQGRVNHKGFGLNRKSI